MRTVCWNEQDEHGNDIVREMTDYACCSYQRHVAREHNGTEYESQDEALQDFMAVHWAWFKEDA
jgi:hypothetical protein